MGQKTQPGTEKGNLQYFHEMGNWIKSHELDEMELTNNQTIKSHTEHLHTRHTEGLNVLMTGKMRNT